MEIEKIRYYISYFETVHAETACRWEGSQKLKNGAFSMPFPVYETQFLDFIDDISSSDLMDVNYGGTLEEYGFEMNHELTKKIDTADLLCPTRALLRGTMGASNQRGHLSGTAETDRHSLDTVNIT